jgi:phage terminase small subunit
VSSGAKVPRAPAGLSARARRFWREWLDQIEPDGPHDVELLAEAARTMSLIDALEQQVKADGLMVAGSRGQRRLHPAVPELTKARALLDRLLSRMTPRPDVPESPTTIKARRAALTRWHPPRPDRTAPDRTGDRR